MILSDSEFIKIVQRVYPFITSGQVMQIPITNISDSAIQEAIALLPEDIISSQNGNYLILQKA